MDKALWIVATLVFLYGTRLKKRSGYIFSAAIIVVVLLFKGNLAMIFSYLQSLGMSTVLSLLFGTLLCSVLTFVIAMVLEKIFGAATDRPTVQSFGRNQ